MYLIFKHKKRRATMFLIFDQSAFARWIIVPNNCANCCVRTFASRWLLVVIWCVDLTSKLQGCQVRTTHVCASRRTCVCVCYIYRVSRIHQGIDTFWYPCTIPKSDIDAFWYLTSIPKSGIDTFWYPKVSIPVSIPGIDTWYWWST